MAWEEGVGVEVLQGCVGGFWGGGWGQAGRARVGRRAGARAMVWGAVGRGSWSKEAGGRVAGACTVKMASKNDGKRCGGAVAGEGWGEASARASAVERGPARS